MKKKIVLGALVLVIAGSLFPGCATVLWKGTVFHGEQEPLIADTRWEMQIQPTSGNLMVNYIHLVPGGQALWYTTTGAADNRLGKDSYWERSGNVIRIVAFNGYWLCESNIPDMNNLSTATGTVKYNQTSAMRLVMSKR